MEIILHWVQSTLLLVGNIRNAALLSYSGRPCMSVAGRSSPYSTNPRGKSVLAVNGKYRPDTGLTLIDKHFPQYLRST